MAQASRLMVASYVLGMLLSGTLNTLATKIQFTLSGVGLAGEEKIFKKPWFGAYNMLESMAFVMICEQIIKGCSMCKKSQDGQDKDVPLLGEGDSANKNMSWSMKVLYVSIPAAFDLLATALGCIGILYIPASVWQILRGSAIVFAAIFSIVFLKRRMFAFNWIGLFLCISGVAVVGLASVLGGDANFTGDTGLIVFGMVVVLLAQVVQAAQIVLEEWLMKEVDLPAFQIIGFEGVWGILIMVVIGFPICYWLPGDDYGNTYENVFDTAVMLHNTPQILTCVLIYVFSCATFNATGILVTSALSSVHRMMLDASRTTLIWAFGLLVTMYWDKDSAFGEKWTTYSYLQFVGFLILVCGQAVYGEVFKIPGLFYPEVVDGAILPLSPGTINLASPLPRFPSCDGDSGKAFVV